MMTRNALRMAHGDSEPASRPRTRHSGRASVWGLVDLVRGPRATSIGTQTPRFRSRNTGSPRTPCDRLPTTQSPLPSEGGAPNRPFGVTALEAHRFRQVVYQRPTTSFLKARIKARSPFVSSTPNGPRFSRPV